MDDNKLHLTMVGHGHIDPVWLWDWREGYETIKATFRSALDRIAENPDLVYAHSSAAQYRWMENHPEMLAEIKEAVARGQWEIVGGFWVESDTNIPSGEALARQGLYGQGYLHGTFGHRATVAFLPDTFGHPAMLPQILRLAGLRYFVFMRPGTHEHELPSNLFWWQGPDGSAILTVRVPTYVSNSVDISPSLEQHQAWWPQNINRGLCFFGVGNHGGGPTKRVIASIRAAAVNSQTCEIEIGRIDGFFQSICQRDLPVIQGELQHHARGCYSALAPIKTLNRAAEQALVDAEKWATVATAYGGVYPAAALRLGWENLLFNQFHDILAGTATASAYQKALHQVGETLSIADRADFLARQRIAHRIATIRPGAIVDEVMRRRKGARGTIADLGDGVPVVVFNSCGHKRHEAIEVEVNDWSSPQMRVLDQNGRVVQSQQVRAECITGDRKRVAFLAEVPALGYSLYRLVDEPSQESQTEDTFPLSASPGQLENRWWRLRFDARHGYLTSIYDKTQQLELLAGPGARLLVMDDPSDTWSHRVERLRSEDGAFSEARYAVIEEGPIRATVAVEVRYGHSAARQEITLYRGISAIHGRLSVNWQEQRKVLKLAFPLAIEQPVFTAAAPYGSVVRTASGDEEPIQEWLDVTGLANRPTGQRIPYGVSLLNKDKYGCDVHGAEVRLTILRSPVYAHHDPRQLETGVAYYYQDQGWHETAWELLPHTGSWQATGVPAAAQNFNAPLSIMREYAHAGELPAAYSFLHIEPEGAILITAFKQAEYGDGCVLRGYEPHGRTVDIQVQIPAFQADFSAKLQPYQIKSWRIGPNGQVKEVDLLEGEDFLS